MVERNAALSMRTFDSFLSLLFGAVMLAAAIPHWANPYYFLGSVYAYKLVEPGIGQMTAVILPLLQLILAVCLLLRIYLSAAHVTAFLLFGLFFAVQLWAYVGGLDISCGCFGPQFSSKIGLGSLTFVGTLLGLAAVRMGGMFHCPLGHL